MQATPEGSERDPLTAQIITAAIEVHRHLGPGLLEAAYEHCLRRELEARGVAVKQQLSLPIVYKGEQLDVGFRIDLVVAAVVVVEVKSVERISSLAEAQVLTYLRLSGMHTALILNFNCSRLNDGIRRLVL